MLPSAGICKGGYLKCRGCGNSVLESRPTLVWGPKVAQMSFKYDLPSLSHPYFLFFSLHLSMCSVYFLPRLVALQYVYVMCLRLIKYIRYLVQFSPSVSAFLLYFLLLYLVACSAPLDIFQVANRSTCFRCQIRRDGSRRSPRRRGKGLDQQHCEDMITF